MNRKSDSLIVEIARCRNLEHAISSPENDCNLIVKNQLGIRGENDCHTPEPWFGNLENAQVIGISSNPSINEDLSHQSEVFPNRNSSDKEIIDFFGNRLVGERPFVTFKHDGVNDFLTLCQDGKYRSGTKRETSPQPTWLAVHNRMIEILGDSANPKVNYCLTEIVHCKSKNAIGVKEAAKTCLPNWFEKKMFLCPAPVVIIFGSHARNFLRMELKNASEDFGSEAKYAGMSQRERSLRDISLEVFGGKKRLVIFNFKNGSSQIQKLREVYGSKVLSYLNAVSRLEEQMPKDSNELRNRLEELF